MDSKDNKNGDTAKDSPSSKSKTKSKAKTEDKVRASKRSKQDRAAKDLGRSNHTTSREPGAVSDTKSARRDPKERKARRSSRSSSHQSNSGPSPGACSSSRGSGSGKSRDRDRETKERRKGSRPSGSSRDSVSRETRNNRKAARNAIVATSGPTAENANAGSDEIFLQAELIPEEPTEEKPAAVLTEASPATATATATATAMANPAGTHVARPSGPFNPGQAPPQGIQDSSDADFEGNRSRNGGLCFRKFWIALVVLVIGGIVGGYFALRDNEDTAPSQDLSVSVYLPPSTEDCRAVEAGLAVAGQDDLTSRSLQTVLVVVLANEDAVAEFESITQAIFDSLLEHMTCCDENGRRLSHLSYSSMIRGDRFRKHRLLQNKDCAVANAEVSLDTTSPLPVKCNATTTDCQGNNQDVDNSEVLTVEVNANFKFYLKGDEDEDLLVQTLGDALEEGQKDNFRLPEGLVLLVVLRTKDKTSAPRPVTKAPTLSPSITPSSLPLTLSPSSAELVPTTSPTKAMSSKPTSSPIEAIPDETTNPTLKPTKAPSIAPAPGVTPQPTGTPSLKPSTIPSTIPTTSPSTVPTVKPTPGPTESPSVTPSSSPTKSPTSAPTASPTKRPTTSPTVAQSQSPSTAVDARRAVVEGILSDHAPFDQEAMDWLVETDTWEPDEGDPDSDYLWLERYALAALYYSTNGDNWTEKTNWLSAEPVCTWAVIGWRTNACPGPIWVLILDQNNLQGTLPDVITKLNRLYFFTLNNNAITGTIPEIAENSLLLAFSLGNNQLTGSIPESIGNLGALTNLALLNNQMSGTIPETITSMSSLRLLYLRGNSLGETIPTYMSQLSNLQRLDMTSTGLKGPIPSVLADMPSITGIELGYNELGGTFPEFLLQMTQLIAIGLDHTGMTGSMPENIWTLTNLYSLNLANNQMVGTIPEGLSSLAALVRLYLEGNSFTGTIPILPANQFVVCTVNGNCFEDDSNAVGRCLVGNVC